MTEANGTNSPGGTGEEERDALERGAVAVIVAITLMPLLLIASYATDLGLWLNRSHQIQRSADLAALAGAAEMPNVAQARAVAEETLRRNGFVVCPWVDCDPDLTAAVEFPEPGQIRVRLGDNKVPAFLANPATGDLSMSRIATSTYLPELALGSPANTFGASSVPVGVNDQQIFAAVSGLGQTLNNGSPFGACPRGQNEVPTSRTACPGGVNPTFDGNGYYYAIDVQAAGEVVVELFDANHHPEACIWPDSTCDGGAGTSTITYEVLQADDTPWDWEDNQTTVPGCTLALGPGDGAAFTNSWGELCRFNAPGPGLYVFNIRSSNYRPWAVAAGAQAFGDDNGRYNYSLRATAAVQPQVYGLGAASFFSAVSTDRDASYWLAEIAEAYRGKTLQFDIYDPGEMPAGTYLQLMMPGGSADPLIGAEPNIGQVAQCVMETLNHPRSITEAGPSAEQACRVQVTSSTVNNGSLFNGKWLRMTVQVPDTYTCAAGPSGCFWWMKIDLDNSISPVRNDTERSVFTAQVLGDPIRLIE